jgi:2'-5' RNA ligase
MENGDKPKTLRLFVAMSPPEDVKDRIEKAQDQLRRATPGKIVRWIKRDQFHLTLKFLGNVAEPRVGELIEALRAGCTHFAPFCLRAEGIGFFPGARVPRVLWAGVSDKKGTLPELQRVIQTGVKKFTQEDSAEPGSAGVPPASQFTGHITLGRIQRIRPAESEALSQATTAIANPFFGEWTANCVALIRSELSPGGSRYTTVAAIPLSGAP